MSCRRRLLFHFVLFSLKCSGARCLVLLPTILCNNSLAKAEVKTRTTATVPLKFFSIMAVSEFLALLLLVTTVYGTSAHMNPLQQFGKLCAIDLCSLRTQFPAAESEVFCPSLPTETKKLLWFFPSNVATSTCGECSK